MQKENDDLQDKLDKVADLVTAPEGDCDESPDELVDKLNDIIDVVLPEDADDEEGNGYGTADAVRTGGNRRIQY